MKVKCLSWFRVGTPLQFFIGGYTEDGQKCSVHVKNFLNEIYIIVAEDKWNVDCMEEMKLFIRNSTASAKVKIVVKKANLVKRKSMYGYHDLYCYQFFLNGTAWNIANLEQPPFAYKVSNDDVPEVVKFVTNRNIEMCGWMELSDYEASEQTSFIYIRCDWQSIHPVPKGDPIYTKPVIPHIFYFDIECEYVRDFNGDEEEESDDDEDEPKEKPTTDITDDNIIQISVVTTRNSEVDNIYLLTLYDVRSDLIVDAELDIPKVRVIKCITQQELIVKFIDLIANEDPDIISGYNTLEFDWHRILTIAERVKIDPDTYLIGSTRTGLQRARNTESKWSSSAYADKKFHFLGMEGRSNLDVYQYVQRSHYRLPSYSLKEVSKHFLEGGEANEKMDVDYKVIRLVSQFIRTCRAIEDPTIEKLHGMISMIEPSIYFSIIEDLVRALHATSSIQEFWDAILVPSSLIGKYCVVDSLLCHKLMVKLQALGNVEAMASITQVTIEDVIYRGNQHRSFSLEYKFFHNEGIIMNKPDGWYENQNSSINKYTGARVLPPKIGHFNGVFTLDFASLYPSIIICHNLCYTTISQHRTETTKTVSMVEGTYNFEVKREGILPKMLKTLLAGRKEVRDQMKTLDPDSFAYQLLDCRQQVLKITANSVYGSLGAKGGKRLLMPAAAAITSIGRDMIEHVKNYVEGIGFEVIYGDTDSNIIRLPINLSKPYIVHDSNLMLERLADVSLEDTPTLRELLETEYDICEPVFVDNVLNVPLSLLKRAERIAKELAKNATNEINSLEGTSFNLEYENCFEHYIQLGKKYYIGKKYATDALVKKGVLSVKRTYANVEKQIYDATVRSMFDSKQSPVEVYASLIHQLFSTYKPTNDYIVTSSIKELCSYADQVVPGVFIDENKKRFHTKNKYDPRYNFSRLPGNVRVALNMYNRGEPCQANARLEMIYYQIYIGSSWQYEKKGEKLIDYQYVYRNKQFIGVDKMMYVGRLENPIAKLFETAKIELKACPSVETIHIRLGEYFGKAPPSLDRVLKIGIKTINSEGGVTTSNIVGVEKDIILADLSYEDLSRKHFVEDLKTMIARQKVIPESQVTINRSSEPMKMFEDALLLKCRAALNSADTPKEIKSLCATLNSRCVIRKLYVKYRIIIYKSNHTICSDITKLFARKQRLLAQLIYRNSVFDYNIPPELKVTYNLRHYVKPEEDEDTSQQSTTKPRTRRIITQS